MEASSPSMPICACDTRKASEDDRPDVHTREVKTLVRVADGERVILGGLRQKEIEKSRDSVPFLGDLPGIGKLFGHFCSHRSVD